MLMFGTISPTTAMQFEHFDTRQFETVPEYGVIFRAVHDNFLPTDSFMPLVFKVKFPQLPELPVPEQPNLQKCHSRLQIHEADVLEAAKLRPGGGNARKNETMFRAFERQLQVNRKQNCIITLRAAKDILIKYDALRSDIESSYTGLLQIVGQKLTKRSNFNRNKRAWIDISYLGETVFGFAQAKHVHALQQSVENLLDNQYNLANKTEELTDKLTVLANITSRRIDNIWDELDQRSKSISQSFRTIAQSINTLTNRLASTRSEHQLLHDWSTYKFTFQDNLLLLYSDAVLLRQKISLWNRSIIRLYSGFLPEEIITPSELIYGLNQLQNNLYKHNPQFRLTHTVSDINYFYTQRNTKLFVLHPDKSPTRDLILYIAVKIPVATRETKLVTYQVLALPVPLNSNGTNFRPGYTKLRLPNEFFITTVSKSSWTELSKQDYDYCTSILDNTCPALYIDKSIHDVSCLSALFYKQYDEIEKHCQVDFFPKAPRPIYTAFISEGTFLVSVKEKIEFICPKYPKTAKIMTYGVLKMPCACAMSAGNLYIPPSLAHCNLNPEIIHATPLFNAVQYNMEGYNTNEVLQKYFSGKITHNEFSTPEFDQIPNYINFQDKDDYIRMDLQAQRLDIPKELKPLKQIVELPNKVTTPEYAMHICHFIIEGVLVAGLVLVGGFTFRLVMFMKLLKPSIAAITYPKNPYSNPIMQPPISHNDTASFEFLKYVSASSPLTQAFVTFIAFALQIVAILIIKYLYEKYKRKHQLVPKAPTTATYLHITDIRYSKTIRLFHIAECIKRVKIVAMPAITVVTPGTAIIPCISPKTTFVWSHGLQINALNLSTAFSLPTSVTVPTDIANKLVQTAQTNNSDVYGKIVSVNLIAICSCCNVTKTGVAKICNPNFPGNNSRAISTESLDRIIEPEVASLLYQRPQSSNQ